MAPAPVAADWQTMSMAMTSDSDTDTDSSISSEVSSESESSSSDNWSDLLGSDWRGFSSSSDSSSDAESLSESSSDDEMPELHPAGYPDSDEEDELSDSENSGSESGDDADDEEGWQDGPDDVEEFTGPRTNNPMRWARHNLQDMYAHRYESPRDAFPHGPVFMRHVLGTMKDTRPDLFRQEVRMSPFTFDRLVKELENDPVFGNDSNHGQMPVEDQVAITLFRFGHSGNASGLQQVANWAGVGKGTIILVTRRVMTAVLRPQFMAGAVRMPTASEKEKAKSWVEKHSCKAWRNGWCMVDGTLVPLFDRPFWFGESYFDRKCNYSLNIQVRISIDLSSSNSDLSGG